MYKHFIFAVALILFSAPVFAQKYFTRDARVKFSSETPMEKIEGLSKTASCVLDTKTGKMEWKVLVKGFKFEKALMEEHFNENYMESTKFPNATFKGEITNLSDINFNQEGKYNAKVKGKMNIHGVEKEVTADGVVKVAGGIIEMQSYFNVLCADYNIAIPAVVRDNIAKEVKVAVNAKLNPLK
jgi:hypothetical protein